MTKTESLSCTHDRRSAALRVDRNGRELGLVGVTLDATFELGLLARS